MNSSRCASPGIKQQIESDVVERSIDGLTATETFRAVIAARPAHGRAAIRLLARGLAARRWPATASGFWSLTNWTRRTRDWLEQYYRTQVRPVLTPLAIDPGASFPATAEQIAEHHRAVWRWRRNGEVLKHLAVVQVPRVLPRLVKLPREDGRQDYRLLGRLIGHFLGGPVSRHEDPRLLAFPRHAQQRALHRRGGSRPTCSRRSRTNCTTGAKATPCGWRLSTIARLRFAQALLETLRLTEEDLYRHRRAAQSRRA